MSDLLQGTLDLLILKILNLQPMHGFGISARIQQISGEIFQVNQGSLYPALHRLEQKGWIEAKWDITENNRKAKYYRLTRTGKKQLQKEEKEWIVLSKAIRRILQAV
ncbi:MAG: PadR family transcriptional regulator [Acidobacteria bacterium]|nr:MAG: PadR family transcriptional regulator [Acidobacteriota bacterium]